MNYYNKHSAVLSIKHWVRAGGIALALSVCANVHAETIAGVDFDDDAFVDTVISSSGNFGPTVFFPASVGAGDTLEIIGPDIDSFPHSLDSGAYIEIGFTDNAIVNAPGPDVGIFELGNILEPHFFTLTVADMLSSTKVVQVDTSFTGFTNSRGTNINYGSLDLSDLGVPDGATVTSLVFTSVCDASTEILTGGACTAGDQTMAATAVIGALNNESVLPTPVCDIQMSQEFYIDGDTVTASVVRLANPTAAPVATEIKIWLGIPGISPVSVVNQGSDGNIVLNPAVDIDLGPAPLFPTTGLPPGRYEFSCRFLDPVTGRLLAEDRNFFFKQ